jgi:agmatine deiminase
MLLAPADPSDPDHESGRENLRRLHEAQDAKGRRLKVIEFDPGSPGALSYMNFYLPNGAAIVPVAASPTDEIALEQIRRAFPDRVVVPVEGRTIAEGGGGPHCITQQLPLGIPAQP